MASNSVFIGLVSHSKSPYLQSQGLGGLSAQLAQSFSDLGVSSQIQIHTANLFDQSEFALTPKMARASVREEIRLESAWSRFLQRPDRISQRVRVLGRSIRFYLGWKSNSKTKELRRLLNIEYSHVDLYRLGVESGCDWVIILEDDAFARTPATLAAGLKGVFSSSHNVKMINLSESFALSEIGIEHLLTDTHSSDWPEGETAYSSLRPATNTVCAIAFRADFLRDLVADFDSEPAEPVVPIDWKLNAGLMRLWANGLIRAGECWFIEPGPVLQLSMHKDQLD